MSNKFFTIYWLNGTRTVIQGETIEQAFTAAGYDDSTVKSINWYDNGVSETHFWNQKEWVKYEPICIHAGDDLWKKPFSEVKEVLVKYLKQHHEIIVQFESKNELSLKLDWDDFSILGPVKYLKVAGAEYFQGTYYGDSDDEENAHHFMDTTAEYFSPTDIETACKALYERVNSGSICKASNLFGDHLEDIAAHQTSFD